MNVNYLKCLNIAILIAFSSLGFHVDANTVSRYFKTSDKVSLHYTESKSRDVTLIFVPGWLMPGDIFSRQIEALSDQFHVVVFDPRGQGLSGKGANNLSAGRRAQDIKELLRHAKVKKYVLIGWSLGVMESLDYINRFGSVGLKGLVLIDNSIGMGVPPMQRSSRGGSRPTKKADFSDYIEKFGREIFALEPAPVMLESVIKSALKLSPTQAWGLLNKPYPREYYAKGVMSVDVPVWYAITKRFGSQGEELLEKHPKALVTIFENSGHALFVDESQRFNQLLISFMDAIK